MAKDKEKEITLIDAFKDFTEEAITVGGTELPMSQVNSVRPYIEF